MKVVVYTVITNGYDNLRECLIDNPNYDYIAYVDELTPVPKNTKWQIRPIPDDIKHLDKIMQQAHIKILPHKYFPEYDISIFCDGKVQMTRDVTELLTDDMMFATNKHPHRDCIYDECSVLSKLGFEKRNVIANVIDMLKKNNYPTHHGLLDTCMMIRRHNDPYVYEIMDQVWQLIVDLDVTRLEILFNYVLFLQNKTITLIPFDNFKSKYFLQHPHAKTHYKF